MSEKIDQIIENIEQSFNQLNTSVELLKKAENIASESTQTTSKLIKEFQSNIKSVEKIIKIDFANEYNKLAENNNLLLEKINEIDFDKKFSDVKKQISQKNFDSDFNNIISEIADINFDKKFKSVELKIGAISFDTKFSSLNNAIAKINFDNKFQSVEQKVNSQIKEIRKIKTLLYILFVILIIGILSSIFLKKIINF